MKLQLRLSCFVLFFGLAACSTTAILPTTVHAPSEERQPATEYNLPPAIAKRAQELSRFKDLATGNHYRSREALGGARLERHLQGRKLTPGKNTSVDWVDQKLGDISFKGPLIDDSNFDGVLEHLEHFNLEAIKNAVRRDLQNNPKAPSLVIDLFGLSDGETKQFISSISELPNPFNKRIFILLEKEMKTFQSGPTPAGFDQYPN